MTDVVALPRRQSATQHPKDPKTLKSVFGDDAWLLKLCAEWRAARARQQINWAEYELAIGWGHLPDDHLALDLAPLHRMQQIACQLAQVTPRTTMLARELLGICLTILAQRNEDPESTLADGPVVDILRNVISSLGYLKGDRRIGPKQATRDDS